MAPLLARGCARMAKCSDGRRFRIRTTEAGCCLFLLSGTRGLCTPRPTHRAPSNFYRSSAPASFPTSSSLSKRRKSRFSLTSQSSYALASRGSMANSHWSLTPSFPKFGSWTRFYNRFFRFALLAPSLCHAILYSLPPPLTRLGLGCPNGVRPDPRVPFLCLGGFIAERNFRQADRIRIN